MENRLRQVFQSAIQKLSLSPDAALKYTASATEQEIVTGALKVQDASEHVFCFLRDIQRLPDDSKAVNFREADIEAAHKQATLKARLKQPLPGNIHEDTAQWQGDGPSLEHLDQLCDNVYAALAKVIRAEVRRLEAVEPLEREVAAHAAFGVERAHVFIGRMGLLKAIGNYIAGSDLHPLAIGGASGSGKSALMAKAVEQAQRVSWARAVASGSRCHACESSFVDDDPSATQRDWLCRVDAVTRRFRLRLRDGDIFLLYLIWYPVNRILVESLRPDAWTVSDGLATAQLVSLVLM